MEPTREQQQIIHHGLDSHAVVLAVAGSGKTTTMVQRIQHLTKHVGVSPKGMVVSEKVLR